MQHPEPHEPGWELWLYRRRRAGLPLAAAENEHLDSLASWFPRFEEMAEQHDEQDQAIRAEIARKPHAYGWHKSLGQLPFDWHDSELCTLRPHDWNQAKNVRFVRVTSPRTPKTRMRSRTQMRAREHRPAATRRASSSSTTSSADLAIPT